MSLRRDLRVFREPGFYVSVILSVILLGGLLIFGGLTAPRFDASANVRSESPS